MTVAAALVLAAVTAGWEDVNPDRQEHPPVKVVWRADLTRPDSLTIECRGGASGTMRAVTDGIRLEKTNDEGYIVVKAPAFAVPKDEALRLFADVEVFDGEPDYSCGFLRAHGTNESFRMCYELETQNFSMGGQESMRNMRHSAPGTPYRKYAHFRAKDGVVTPVIVLTGGRSASVWRNWTAEDLDAAQAEWRTFYATKTAKDNAAAMIDEDAFDRKIAADTEHTAEVRTIDGVSRLLIDGEITLPVAYNAKGAFGDDATMETFRGNDLAKSGVKLMIRSVGMGGKPGTPRHYWSKDGFDAKGAVADFKRGMRIAPDSLFLIRLSCNAYPAYTAEHPEEVWKTEDGTVVRGTSGSCVIGYDDMGIKDTNRWPWVSYASRRWREDIKANIRALIAEFRRQGLDKRIVGVHLSGYQDGQFTAPYPDFSEPAKREYARYLAEKPTYTNYLFFAKQIGFRAQEEFAREFKRALGKKSVAIRWCEAIFSATEGANYDFTAFANSDAIDIATPQPPYERRHPGIAIGPKLPQASFHRHGKMFWYELDLRTYGALESWAASAVATKGLGQQDDIIAFRSSYRKLAGVMMGLRSGYWFYDMGGGWFSPPEISQDVSDVMKSWKSWYLKKPSSWHPDVAVVVDEANPAVFGDRRDLKLPLRHRLMATQWNFLAGSGVPYETYLAEDVLEHPDWLKDRKMLVLGLFRHFDARRLDWVRRMMKDGKTIVFLAESGVAGGDVEATGFKVTFDRSDSCHEIVAEPGVREHCASIIFADQLSVFHDPKVPFHLPNGPRCSVVEAEGVNVLARYRDSGQAAIVWWEDDDCRRVYVGEPCGLTPALINRLARDAGAYVPSASPGLQVDMNGDFISVHALRTGRFDFRLPFTATVTNLHSGREEPTIDGVLPLNLTAGETCWFALEGEK